MGNVKNEYHRYDIIEAEIQIALPSGSVQRKKRPYIIVGNEKGTITAPTVIAMPLTHIIKKTIFLFMDVLVQIVIQGCLCIQWFSVNNLTH